MNSTDKNMGIPFVPFTFPAHVVHLAITTDLSHLKDEWSFDKVQSLYNAYKDAILNEGYKRYDQGQTEVQTRVQEKTGLPLDDVKIFLVYLRNMANDGRIANQYWNVEAQRETIPAKVTQTLKNIPAAAGDFTKNVQWILFAAAGLAAIYMIYQMNKKRRS